jgi:hypothetical protein
MRVIERSPHRPRARLMEAACRPCRAVVLAAVLALSLSSCVSAAGECSGLFVPENEECEPGCGVPVGRRILDASGCTVGHERMRWCVRGPGVLTEDIRCRVDETDNAVYFGSIHPDPGEVPANVRDCTESEETPAACE